LIRKLVNRLAERLIRRRGYSRYMATILWKDLCKDLLDYDGVTLRDKLWCYRRGFLSESIHRYGLDATNAHRYLPYFAYLKMHPLNGAYSHWIDDKLTLRHTFDAYARYLPGYHYHVRKGCILRLRDCPHPNDSEATVDEVIELLESQGRLAAKPVSASGGKGFMKLEYQDGSFRVLGTERSRSEVSALIRGFDDYIVTDYVQAHRLIRRIYPDTANLLRVVFINPNGHAPALIGSIMRFGLAASGGVDSAGSGAIFCGVDLDTGRLTGPRRLIGRSVEPVGTHPDTGEPIEGFVLPHWAMIRHEITTIGRAFPQLVHLGYDIAITDDGFKIIEINSLSDIKLAQAFYPLFDREPAASFYRARIH
jgi:hypothetical protein